MENAEQFSELEMLHRLPGDNVVVKELAMYGVQYSVHFIYCMYLWIIIPSFC